MIAGTEQRFFDVRFAVEFKSADRAIMFNQMVW